MRQPAPYIGAVMRGRPGAMPKAPAVNPPTPSMPAPVQSFKKTLNPDGRATPQTMDVNPMAKRRVPDDLSDTAYTEIRKMGAYRAFMLKAHARM